MKSNTCPIERKMYANAFARVVRDRRAALGLTRGEVMSGSGLSHASLSRYESRLLLPGILEARRLADGLRWTLTEMVAAIDDVMLRAVLPKGRP